MATTDNVQVSTATGANGQQYTQAISNDKLTNEDFLNLMLEQMKQQDPTKPMDSQSMLDSQMQMSTIETNLDMSTSMKALQQSFAQMNLSNAANVIGRVVEDNNTDDEGNPKSYQVASVESVNGEVVATAYQILSYTAADPETDTPAKINLSKEMTKIPYNNITRIF
ncbi:MAG: flagellar hook capping FlgD N-terminal domain-containing protein [Arcobacter sp.]|uniref:flagellar hook assembly protein FlgD n=1 Tax=Arcobacter sp. TaxID=1872629 RepID=UPI003C72F08B